MTDDRLSQADIEFFFKKLEQFTKKFHILRLGQLVLLSLYIFFVGISLSMAHFSDTFSEYTICGSIILFLISLFLVLMHACKQNSNLQREADRILKEENHSIRLKELRWTMPQHGKWMVLHLDYKKNVRDPEQTTFRFYYDQQQGCYDHTNYRSKFTESRISSKELHEFLDKINSELKRSHQYRVRYIFIIMLMLFMICISFGELPALVKRIFSRAIDVEVFIGVSNLALYTLFLGAIYMLIRKIVRHSPRAYFNKFLKEQNEIYATRGLIWNSYGQEMPVIEMILMYKYYNLEESF